MMVSLPNGGLSSNGTVSKPKEKQSIAIRIDTTTDALKYDSSSVWLSFFFDSLI
jgi:hypothetical protein